MAGGEGDNEKKREREGGEREVDRERDERKRCRDGARKPGERKRMRDWEMERQRDGDRQTGIATDTERSLRKLKLPVVKIIRR